MRNNHQRINEIAARIRQIQDEKRAIEKEADKLSDELIEERRRLTAEWRDLER